MIAKLMKFCLASYTQCSIKMIVAYHWANIVSFHCFNCAVHILSRNLPNKSLFKMGSCKINHTEHSRAANNNRDVPIPYIRLNWIEWRLCVKLDDALVKNNPGWSYSTKSSILEALPYRKRNVDAKNVHTIIKWHEGANRHFKSNHSAENGKTW